MKHQVEQTYFKVLSPAGMFARMKPDGELEVVSYDSLRKQLLNVSFWKQEKNEYFMEPFFPTWVRDSGIKTFERVDFRPPPLDCPANVYNTFKGFRVDALAKTLTPAEIDAADDTIFVEHLDILGGRNPDMLRYQLNWLAQRCQMPGELPRSMIMYQGDEGTGKNIFWDELGNKFFGPELYYTSENGDDFLSRFAVGFRDKVLVSWDEIGGLNQKEIQSLKTAITAPVRRAEDKGVKPGRVTHTAGIVGFSNKRTMFPTGNGQRRWTYAQTSMEKRVTGHTSSAFWRHSKTPRGLSSLHAGCVASI